MAGARKSIFAFLTVFAAGSQAFGSAGTELEMWRLDCGEMIIDDISYFSDTYRYAGKSADLGNGCYLIRHGEHYLLWDAGLSKEYLNNSTKEDGWLETISSTLVDQLTEIGVSPADIDYLGVSHFHGDHIGQAADFGEATLLISRADADWIRKNPPGNARRRLSHWFDGEAEIVEFSGDQDVFGDASVIITATPGHTPGHSSLLVFLKNTGPVFLTGDLFHFHSEVGLRNVSRWNTSRADTLASIERFEELVEALNPVVIVQHDKDDIAKLPAFPAAAD